MNSGLRTASFCGLLVRRERWSLTLLGGGLFICLVAATILAFTRAIYPFLAVTDRVDSRVLVIDGWLPTYELDQAVSEYGRGGYDTVLSVRAVYDYETSDSFGQRIDYVSNLLGQKGIPRSQLHPIIFEGFARDRTLSSAVAVSDWLRDHNQTVNGLDLVTEGAHARRSRLLYQRAFGPSIRIGVVAVSDPSYDPKHWWRSSEGVRSVLFEGFAYLFVRLNFFPPKNPSIHLIPVALIGIYLERIVFTSTS